jgi:hypothetical protein
LNEQAMTVMDAVRGLIGPDRLGVRRIVAAVETSRVGDGCDRRKLIAAAEAARKRWWPAYLVAVDRSRFIRAEAYDRKTEAGRLAEPTAAEYARLRELTGGVPLVTVEPPDLTEAERQSRAIRRSGKAGRPRAVDDQLAARLALYFAEHYIVNQKSGRRYWVSQVELAKVVRRWTRKKVSPNAVRDLLRRPAPDGSGRTLGEWARALWKARLEGPRDQRGPWPPCWDGAQWAVVWEKLKGGTS